jgi:hypothetical protein
MTLRRGTWLLAATVTGSLCALLVLAPAASAATDGGQLVPLGFLGLPSLHSIIEAIAKGFFSALAGALVPGFLKHGSVALIQHLVALPDPARWGHVSELEGDMTYLGMSLMPVSLTVCTLRYWMMGLTGAAHPAAGIARCAWATFVLVIYRWLVEQIVAATNTLTHAILGFPVVANGLASIVTVLFGGALLIGAGGVFGAFLVIVGVAFAAGLFASKVALTDVLALAYCAGPLLVALWPIPELSHLMRVWGHALMAVVLVPLGWTLLFAVAGALTLDATSLSGGASGIGGHIEAAFAGLIAFVIAVKLPLMLLGELRHILGSASQRASAGSGGGAQGQATMPGAQRMRAAHARLRNVGLEGIPSLGRSAGRAAGALGAPAGGPLGAGRRGLAGAARRTGMVPAAAGAGALGGMAAGGAAARRATGKASTRGGVRERLSRAGAILASAPRDARAAMAGGARRTAGRASARAATARTGSRGQTGAKASNATGKTPARVATGGGKGQAPPGGTVPVPARPRTTAGASAPATPRAKPAPTSPAGTPAKGAGAAQSKTAGTHPGRKVTSSAGREAGPAPPARPASKPGQGQKPPNVTPPPPPRAAKRSQPPRRKRRLKGGGR